MRRMLAIGLSLLAGLSTAAAQHKSPEPSDEEIEARAQYHLGFEIVHPEQPLRAITVPLADGDGKTYFYLRYRLKNVPLPAVDGTQGWRMGRGGQVLTNATVRSHPVSADLDLTATTDVVDVHASAERIKATGNRDAARVFRQYHDVDNSWALLHIARREGCHSLPELREKLAKIGAPFDSIFDGDGFVDAQALRRYADQYPEFLNLQAPFLYGAGHLHGRYDFVYVRGPDGRPKPDRSKPRKYRFLAADGTEVPSRRVVTWWGEERLLKSGDPIEVVKLDEKGEPVLKRDAEGKPVIRRDEIGRPIYLNRWGQRVPKVDEDGRRDLDPATGEFQWQEAFEYESEPLYEFQVEEETIEQTVGYDESGDTLRPRTQTQTFPKVEHRPVIMGGDSRWNTLECAAIFGPTDRHWNEMTIEVRGLTGSVQIVDLQPKFQEDVLIIRLYRPGDSYDRDEDLVSLREVKWIRKPISDLGE